MVSHSSSHSNVIPLRGTKDGINGKISGSGRGHLDHRTSWARSDGDPPPANSYRTGRGCL